MTDPTHLPGPATGGHDAPPSGGGSSVPGGPDATGGSHAANPAAGAPEETPLTSQERTEELRTCPACGGVTGAGSFCEACGTDIEAAHPGPAEPARSGGMLVLGAPDDAPGGTDPETAPEPGPRCQCGGTFLDGYCEQCGSPEPAPRAHVEAPAAAWVAGVTDVGIRHAANQDAMALLVDGDRAALVVCDGVSSAFRSEDASQAAADAAAGVLARATSTGVGVPSSLVPALIARLDAAADAAADAVADVTAAVHADLRREQGAAVELPPQANPSCTFVAAVLDGDHVVVGSVGDSRAYWFPDGAPAQRLTTDDSIAEERIAMGVPRAEAESGPGAHTITRWLGVDSPDHAPRATALSIERPGWLILCSDGLWNYASDPEDLSTVVADVARAVAGIDEHPPGDDQPEPVPGSSDSSASPDPSVAPQAPDSIPLDPLLLARGLVTWANAQGGHDNITVIAARLHDDRKGRTHG